MYSSGVLRLKVIVRHPGFGLCVCTLVYAQIVEWNDVCTVPTFLSIGSLTVGNLAHEFKMPFNCFPPPHESRGCWSLPWKKIKR